jgi:anti-sigma B factor antagonist
MAAERKPEADVSPAQLGNECFRIDVEPVLGGFVVRLHGSAGMEHVDDLQRRLMELPTPDRRHVVLDLSQLHFINSAGLGAFIALYRRCHENGGQVAIASPRQAVAQVLRVTNLDRLMPIYADLESAFKKWPQPPAAAQPPA